MKEGSHKKLKERVYHRIVPSTCKPNQIFTLKVKKVFKSSDLLDYDGRLLALSLALSIGHKCQRDLNVEGSGNQQRKIVSNGGYGRASVGQSLYIIGQGRGPGREPGSKRCLRDFLSQNHV